MGFLDLSWNICVSCLVMMAALVVEILCRTNKQNPTPWLLSLWIKNKYLVMVIEKHLKYCPAEPMLKMLYYVNVRLCVNVQDTLVGFLVHHFHSQVWHLLHRRCFSSICLCKVLEHLTSTPSSATVSFWQFFVVIFLCILSTSFPAYLFQ